MSLDLATLSRADIEDFLYSEAALLDAWRLNEWRDLFTETGTYLIPAMDIDPRSDPQEALFLIADDPHHLTERVKRLNKKTAYAEYPRSTTRRLVSNVRITARESDHLKVESSFITYRTNQGIANPFWGKHEYVLKAVGGLLKIEEKRTILDMEVLRPQGKLTIIV